jgi:hypothetical protein
MTEKEVTMAEDRETVINFCEYHIGKWAEVYTTDKDVMKRFEKFCTKYPDFGRIIKDDKYSMTFSVHPKCASLYPKAPIRRVMTDEQKLEFRNRMETAKNKT